MLFSFLVFVFSWSLAFVGGWAGRPGRHTVIPEDTSFLLLAAGHPGATDTVLGRDAHLPSFFQKRTVKQVMWLG